MIIIAIIVGLLLGIFHVLLFAVIIKDIKSMILCTKEVDARVKTVQQELKEYEDSQTGKTKYEYSYTVHFVYEHDGQTYESFKNYSKKCRYFRGQETSIKINPHNPEEIWTKGELKGLLTVSLSIPIFVIIDWFYIMCVFYM